MTRYAILCPGQGAQYSRMCSDFYESSCLVRDVFQQASDLLKWDMAKLVFSEDQDALSSTSVVQPAILTVSYAIYMELCHQFPDLSFAMSAGLSLGEYTALVIAGKISFADALNFVAERGRAMQQAALAHPGTMAAVLGLDSRKIEQVVEKCDDVWISTYNTADQTVVGGTISGIEQVIPLLLSEGAKRVVPLSVAGAFHTPLMACAAEILAPLIETLPIGHSKIDVPMNATGLIVQDPDQIRKHLMEQLVLPTRFYQCIKTLEESGIEGYIELGPGKTLSGMVRKSGIKSPLFGMDRLQDMEAFARG